APQTFEEDGPEGRSLGLRPLGFAVVLERVDPGGGAVLRAADGATITVRPGRAASHGGLRFGLAERRGGELSALRIAVAGPQGSSVVGAALALAVAAPLSDLGRAAGRRAADLTSRGLAAGAGLLLLAAARPTALPAAVLAFAAAGIAPRALPCLLAAAAAVAAAAR